MLKQKKIYSFFRKTAFLLCMAVILCSCQPGTDEHAFTTLDEKYVSSNEASKTPAQEEASNSVKGSGQKEQSEKTDAEEADGNSSEKKDRKTSKKEASRHKEPAEGSNTPKPANAAKNPAKKKEPNPPARRPESRQEDKTEKKEATEKPKASKRPKASEEPFSTEQSSTEQSSVESCSILIECSSILENKEHLKESKTSFVPANGIILKKSKIPIEKGDSVYDVLYRICLENKIHIESKYTPAYNTYYVEGINQLYEFDCGNLSGWMYLVNGKKPNYGCSNYKVSAGDAIVWSYTCNAGKDIDG